MEVKVTRKTGLFGAALKVTLVIDEQEKVHLKNNEHYAINTDKDSIKLKAKQWYLGSKEIEIDKNKNVDIKVNPNALTLLVIPLILIFLAALNDVPSIKLIFASTGLIGIGITTIYAIKNWFVFRE